jgi:hypothetical protein
MTRTITVLCACLAAVAVAATTAAGTGILPKRIDLPNGFQPEGIALTGPTFYAGSIPTGAVYRGSVLTGRGAVLVPARQGRAAIGVDVKRGQIFVAGGPTGNAFVYDARTGADVAVFDLATSSDTFVNDVVVTRKAAFFTDSRQQVLYRVELGNNGRATPESAVRRIPLTGDLQYQDGFNANGIDATASGKTLVLVQSNTGRLFTADPETGATRGIDLGAESVPNGDGVLLHGLRLYVVQNRLNVVAKIALAPGLASGRVLRRIGSPDLDVPTTIDRFGVWLYAVNARFGTTPTPDTEYWITRLPS